MFYKKKIDFMKKYLFLIFIVFAGVQCYNNNLFDTLEKDISQLENSSIELVAFVSNAEAKGDMDFSSYYPTSCSGLTGLAGADCACNTEAQSADLPGVYAAFLSNGTVSAFCRVHAINAVTCMASITYWRLPQPQQFNQVVTASSSVTVDPEYQRVSINQYSDGSTFSVDVWTGSNNDGFLGTDTCSDWSSTSDSGVYGVTYDLDYWADSLPGTCDNSKHIYCFQIPGS